MKHEVLGFEPQCAADARVRLRAQGGETDLELRHLSCALSAEVR